MIYLSQCAACASGNEQPGEQIFRPAKRDSRRNTLCISRESREAGRKICRPDAVPRLGRQHTKKSLTYKVRQGRLNNRVTTLFCARLTPARLTRYHHTSAAVTGGPVAALRQRRSVRNSGAMFTRTPRAPFPLSGAHCAVPFGLLFPSLSLRC